MAIRDGAAVALATVGITGLAVGLAYGLHTILPVTEGDASPSASLPAPSVTPAGDICVLMEDMVAVTDELNASSIDEELLFDETLQNDPELLEAIHAQGQASIDVGDTVIAYLQDAADLATDPGVADAFETLARAYEGQLEAFGPLAVEAESVGAYVTAIFAAAADPDIVALMTEADAAFVIAEGYVTETCGRNILGGMDAGVVAAKTDVSLLGKEMAVYYVDWSPSDPPPVITVSDDGYLLNGVFIGEPSLGVHLTDQYARGPLDWCVEVTPDDDPTLAQIYTALSGLRQGTCATFEP
ncbi:MAG: hypothetical protein JW722_02775 [Demequinaceae bacterium]|nr:hypothetical protein [Demequinaceae bacterium]